MPHRTPVTVTSGRHPYEVAVHISMVVCGIALAITDQVPPSATAAMQRPVQVMWIGLLILSGITATVGAYWRGVAQTGMRVELAGVLLLAGGAAMYAFALFIVAGLLALAAGSFVAGIAAGSWWRAGQIVTDLRRIKQSKNVAEVPQNFGEG